MKRIVVATDMSERSDRAIERGVKLSHELNAECSVICIVDDALPEEIASEIRSRKETRLRATLDAHGGETAEIEVRIGDVVPSVLGYEDEKDADLLILGLHRKRAFMDTVRETTMERIVAMSRRPVLLVRSPVITPFSRVLVPVSFSRACAAAIATAGRVAPGAEFSTYHALHVPFAGLTGGELSDLAKAVRRETQEMSDSWQENHRMASAPPEIIAGGVRQVLDRMMANFKPDLLAIGAHTRSGIGMHRIGAFAAELIREPPVDLLVTRS